MTAAEKKATSRKWMTQDQREEERRANREWMESQRRNLTQDEMEEARRANQEWVESHRRNLNVHKHGIATRTTEILNGDIHIPQLNDSKDTIGEMKHECHYCGAIKFKIETSSLCCLD